MRELLLRVLGDARDARAEVLDDIWPPQTARTDAEGHFRFARLPRGVYALHVEHHGYAIGEPQLLDLGLEVAEAVDVVLHTGTILTGVVLRGGEPVADFPLVVAVDVVVDKVACLLYTSRRPTRSRPRRLR